MTFTFIFRLYWVFNAVRLRSSCRAQASHCGGLSCGRAPAWGPWGFGNCSSWALEHRLSCCGSRASWLCDMWGLPRSGLRAALAGRFLTTVAPVCAKLLQLHLTLCNTVDCSLPDFSVHEILQARILEWVAISIGDLPDPGIKLKSLMSSALAGRFFTTSATWEAPRDNFYTYEKLLYLSPNKKSTNENCTVHSSFSLNKWKTI